MSNAVARSAPPVAQDSWLQLLPPATKFILQGRARALDCFNPALGLQATEAACRATANDRCAVLWLGPDERLILEWQDDSATVEAKLTKALAGSAHSLVDVSHRQVGLRVTGPFAADVLNCGCPLDLALEKFAIDSVARTLFGKAEIVLWRRGTQDFHVEVWRSFAHYVTQSLLEASRDFR